MTATGAALQPVQRKYNRKTQKWDHVGDVSRQPHYMQFNIQPMQFCEVNKLGWCASNVIKYVCRENKKNGLQDLMKAQDYLRCLIHYKKTGVFLTPDKLGAMK